MPVCAQARYSTAFALFSQTLIRTGDRLRAFEIKWTGRRTAGRAFRTKYGVDVERLDAGNPFVADSVLGAPSRHK